MAVVRRVFVFIFVLVVCAALHLLFSLLQRRNCNQRPPNEVVQLLNVASSLYLRLFVVDALFLRSVVNVDELRSRGLLPEQKHARLFNLGVFADDVQLLRGLFRQRLAKSGFRFYAYSSAASSGGFVPLHFLLTKNRVVVQVSVFHQRDHFFWTGALPNNVFLSAEKTWFGVENAFDSFKLKTVQRDGVFLLVPDEADHFLAQLSTARFVDCDRRTAKWFKRTFAANSTLTDNDAINKKVELAVVEMKKLMKSLRTPFWIASGTLLGWFRHCAAIAYTTDADFATWSRFASEQLTQQLIAGRKNMALQLRFVFGRPELAYEYAFTTKDGFRVDLFYFYPEDDDYLATSGHYPPWRVFIQYKFKRFSLCSAALFGHRVNVPCDAQPVIEQEYGPRWQHPQMSSNLLSPPNSGPLRYFHDPNTNRTFIDVDEIPVL